MAADEDKAAKRNRAMVTGILCCLIIQRCLLSSCWNVPGGDNMANRSSLRLGGPRLIGVQLRILLGPVAVQAEERSGTATTVCTTQFLINAIYLW